MFYYRYTTILDYTNIYRFLNLTLENFAIAHCGKENKSSHITGEELLLIAVCVFFFVIWQEMMIQYKY